MRARIRLLETIFPALFMLASAAGNDAASQSIRVSSETVDSLFSHWNKPESPGIALAVIQDGNAVHKAGYGMANLEYNIPITTQTIFDIASVSKQFGAMAIAMLIESGKVLLDDDIHTQIPEVPDFGHKITFRHLVHHTSGIRDWPGALAIGGWRMDDVISFQQILNMVWHQRDLNFVPGAEYSYSNTGYNLLAETVARVSKQSFREWTQEHIFAPLEMNDTHFHDDHQEVVRNRAQAYSPTGKGFRSVPNGLTALGSSSLFTTVDDLIKWVNNFEHGRVGGTKVLSRMLQRGVLNNGEQIDYAYGNSIGEYKGLRTVSHSGSWAGFRTFLVRFPDQHFAIILLSNVGNLNASNHAYKVADLYLADRYQVEMSEASNESKSEIALEPVALQEFVGTYKLGPGWYVTLSVENGKLMTQASGEPKFPMSPLSPTRFWVMAYGAEMEFQRDGAGQVTHFDYRGRKAPKVELVSPEAADLSAYAGAYFSEELETIYTVERIDDELVLTHQRHGTISMTPATADLFEGGIWFLRELRFTRNGQGQVDGFEVSNGRVRNLRFSKMR